MEREFAGVIRKRGRWFVGYVEEVPGVNTQGRTLAETRHHLKEALRLVIETRLRPGGMQKRELPA